MKCGDTIITKEGTVYRTSNTANPVELRKGLSPGNAEWDDDSMVTLRIDQNTHSLQFLIDKKLQPVIIKGLPKSVRAGVCYVSC